ncbi:MAG: hypothetical protein MK171_06660 [Pirellulales bacterium]|nr:hypothetical protein [Pirellulales bacterium]
MRTSLLRLAVVAVMVSAAGCGTCRNIFGYKTQPVATSLYSQCIPTCQPDCNSCGSTGKEVTYGYNSLPGTTYSPASAAGSLPMMFPADSGGQ